VKQFDLHESKSEPKKTFNLYKFDLTYNQIVTFFDELKFKTKIDLKVCSLGAIKRIIGGYMDKNNINGLDELIRWVLINPGNKNDFMKAIIPDKTEFFRDPGVWRYLKAELPKMVTEKGNLRILDLGTSTGEDLISLMLVLKETNLSDKVKVVACEKYQVKIDELIIGDINVKKLEPSINNYKRYNDGRFNELIIESGEDDSFKLKESLIQNVEFEIFDLVSGRAFGKFDIVLCRNIMCYYSLKKSRPLYKTLSDFIDKDGLLILGVQEDLANSFYNRDFQNISEEYKIFQKTR
jgi:chemotaxis protein methyltransferase CheR